MDKKNNIMGYLEWSRVIDELESIVEQKHTEIAVNSAFLEKAKQERKKFPEPKPKTNSTNDTTK